MKYIVNIDNLSYKNKRLKKGDVETFSELDNFGLAGLLKRGVISEESSEKPKKKKKEDV